MMIAHIGGVPVEEWLTPLLVMGSGLSLALRAACRRVQDGAPARKR